MRAAGWLTLLQKARLPLGLSLMVRWFPAAACGLTACLLLVGASGECETLWVLGEGQPAGVAAIAPETLADLLAQEGREAGIVSAETAAKSLDAAQVDALVIPGPGYPASLRDPLLAYLHAGAGLIALGGSGAPLTLPTYLDGKAWRPLRDAPEEGAVTLPLDGWSVNEDAGEPVVTVEAVDGRLELRVPDGSAWHYARHAVQGLTQQHALLAFEVRGDGSFEYVCLELNERDGSRWKAWVPAAKEWRRWVVHVGDFLSYATEGRGGPEDAVRPAEISSLSIGGYRSLWGEGAHRLSTRHVSFLKSPVDAKRTHLLSAPAPLMAGLNIADNGGALPVWVEPEPVVAQSLTAPTWETGLSDLPAWRMQVVRDARFFAGVPPTTRCARMIPLLSGEAKGEHSPVAAAFVLASYDGPFRGSRCGFLTLAEPGKLLEDERGAALLQELADRVCARGPMLVDVQLDFDAAEGGLGMAPTVRIVNTADAPAAVELRAVLAGEGVSASATAATDVPGGETKDVSVGIDPALADDQLLAGYELTVQMAHAGRVTDSMQVSVQPEDTLRRAWDWLVSIQQPDGTFSSLYFVDAYAARALMAAGRRDGDRGARYRQAALRWADGMVERQRADGGWWVGYGPADQEIYVADDGSIALGIACLYADVGQERRVRYLAALRRYMAFRESFRNEDGSVGVGHTKTDYFAKPYARFDEVHREMRSYPWTIGCSLGAAAALYAITGDPTDRQRAINDTRYLLANAGKTGLANGYYAEAMAMVHRWVDDEALRREIEAATREHFAATLHKPEYAFWRLSEGRSCLGLVALEWQKEVGNDGVRAPARAAIQRGIARLCDAESPDGILQHIGAEQHLTILTAFGLCGVQENLPGLQTYPRAM